MTKQAPTGVNAEHGRHPGRAVATTRQASASRLGEVHQPTAWNGARLSRSTPFLLQARVGCRM